MIWKFLCVAVLVNLKFNVEGRNLMCEQEPCNENLVLWNEASDTHSHKFQSAPSKRDTSSLIFDRITAKARKYPWTGAFFYNGNFQCGGSLISTRHVLFAANCVQDKNEEEAKEASKSHFYFKNDYNDEDDSARVDVSEFIIHPDWDPKDSHYTANIAIAVLKNPIKLSNEIEPITVNNPSNLIQSFAGRNALVCGWGYTENFKLVSQLHDITIPLVDQALCNSSNPTLANIMSDTSFCAGARDGKTGPCNGDSGNGLVLEIDNRQTLVGIVSAALAKPVVADNQIRLFCDLDNYVIYTDVSKFYHWIKQLAPDAF